MIIKNKYNMINLDSMDYKWCKRKGRFCHKDDYGYECDSCR